MLTINVDPNKLLFLKEKEISKVLLIGEALLGIPQKELGEDYVYELDRVINTLESYVNKDIHTMIWLFSSRMAGLFLGRSLKPFSNMTETKREKYLIRWMKSKIPLVRTMYVTLRALTSWAYYTSESAESELEFPGKTIGREHELPTLLYGKEPYDPKEYLEEETK